MTQIIGEVFIYLHMQNRYLKYLLSILFVLTPFFASANMIWPSLFIIEKYFTWYVILLGLAIETLYAKFFLKNSWLRSFLIVLTANAFSALLGIFLIPLSGICVEILLMPFKPGTFHWSHWVTDFLLAIFLNACVEACALKIFKYSFKQNFWWVLAANATSVAVSIAVFWLVAVCK